MKGMKSTKGEGSEILIVIALIVGIIAFLLIFGGSLGLGNIGAGLGGFGGTALPAQTYSDNVVSVQNKLVSDSTPFNGQQTSIEFTVGNNGQGSVENVEVVLEPPTGFSSVLTCGKQSTCKFNLEEGEEIDVLIKLTADPTISQIIASDVKYSVKYPYSGEREAHIPIVKTRSDLPRGQSFFVSSPSIGPVEARIGTPPSRPTINGGSSVYALDGIDFEVKFDISRVGGGLFSSVAPIELNKDQLKITGTNLQIGFCDKIDEKTGTLKDADGFEIPFSVTCDFRPTASASQVTDGVIKVEFNYDYKLSFSDSFTIHPREVKEIDTGTTEGIEGEEGIEAVDVVGDGADPVENIGSDGQQGKGKSVFTGN